MFLANFHNVYVYSPSTRLTLLKKKAWRPCWQVFFAIFLAPKKNPISWKIRCQDHTTILQECWMQTACGLPWPVFFEGCWNRWPKWPWCFFVVEPGGIGWGDKFEGPRIAKLFWWVIAVEIPKNLLVSVLVGTNTPKKFLKQMTTYTRNEQLRKKGGPGFLAFLGRFLLPSWGWLCPHHGTHLL